MIDDNDVGDAAILSSSLTGFGALLGLLVVLVFAYVACENAKECEAKICPSGQAPKLMEHACLCVTEAK